MSDTNSRSRAWAVGQTWAFPLGVIVGAQVQFAQYYSRFPDRTPNDARNFGDALLLALCAWAVHVAWLIVAARRYRGLRRMVRLGAAFISGLLVLPTMYVFRLLPDQLVGGIPFEGELAIIVLGIILGSTLAYEAAKRVQA